MDAITLLKADHDKVKSCSPSSSRPPSAASRPATELFATIKGELTVHEIIEEEIFYPELKAHPEGQGHRPRGLSRSTTSSTCSWASSRRSTSTDEIVGREGHGHEGERRAPHRGGRGRDVQEGPPGLRSRRARRPRATAWRPARKSARPSWRSPDQPPNGPEAPATVRPHRDLRVPLRALARPVLSARPRAARSSSSMPSVRHGRAQRHLLPDAVERDLPVVGGARPGRLPLRGQGQPLPDPRPRLREPREPVAVLMERAGELGSHLGPVLLQLPPDMRLDLMASATLDALPGASGSRSEPRHSSWFTERPAPPTERGMSRSALPTAAGRDARSGARPIGRYLRFHGGTGDGPVVLRRRARWSVGGALDESGAGTRRLRLTSTTTTVAARCATRAVFARALPKSGLLLDVPRVPNQVLRGNESTATWFTERVTLRAKTVVDHRRHAFGMGRGPTFTLTLGAVRIVHCRGVPSRRRAASMAALSITFPGVALTWGPASKRPGPLHGSQVTNGPPQCDRAMDRRHQTSLTAARG